MEVITQPMPEAPAPEATPITAPEGTSGDMNVSTAAKVLAAAREAKRQAAASAEKPAAEQPQQESAPEADAAPPQELSGETEAQADPEETPTIDPPRSWSREQRERWAQLDPDTQRYLLDRDSQDSAAVRKAQNEAAEQRKAAEAELQAALEQRKQYEAALPVLLQTFQAQHAGQFADVQSFADEQRLAAEDPIRYTQYIAFQRQAQALQQELYQTHQRQEQEQIQGWQSFASKEDSLFAERVPEVLDPEKGAKLRSAAIKTLEDVGFTQDELAAGWNKPNSLSLRDHRIQQLIVDAAKYRAAQTAVKVPQPKPVPQVVKPGTAKTGGKSTSDAQRLQSLEERLNKTGDAKDAWRLWQARKAK